MAKRVRITKRFVDGKGWREVHFELPEIGHVKVYRTAWASESSPWHVTCFGVNVPSLRAAVDHVRKAWDAPSSPVDESYARMEARMVRPGVFEED